MNNEGQNELCDKDTKVAGSNQMSVHHLSRIFSCTVFFVNVFKLKHFRMGFFSVQNMSQFQLSGILASVPSDNVS